MRILWLVFLIATVICEERSTVTRDEDTVEKDWIDPNDPTRGMDLKSKSGSGPSDAASLAALRSYGARADASIKRILNTFFHELKVDPSQGAAFRRKAIIRMDSDRMERVAAFLEAKTENDWSSHERLCADVQGIITVMDEEEYGSSAWSIDNLAQLAQPYIGIANLIVLFPAAFIVLRLMIGTRSMLLVAFWCFFAFSVYTKFNSKYEEQLSKRIEHSSLYKDSCKPPSMLESSLGYLKGLVSISQKSDCRKFIESHQKSIIGEIQLMQVISEVLFDCFLSWIPILGKNLKLFFINFYEGMPLPLAIMASVLLALSMIILPIFLLGYRIDSFLVSIVPHGPAPLGAATAAVANAAAEAIMPRDEPRREPIAQTLQEAVRPLGLTHRRPEKRHIQPERGAAEIEWRNEAAVRERSQSRHREDKRDSWVTPRSPERRSRLEDRKEAKYRSISLPRNNL